MRRLIAYVVVLALNISPCIPFGFSDFFDWVLSVPTKSDVIKFTEDVITIIETTAKIAAIINPSLRPIAHQIYEVGESIKDII